MARQGRSPLTLGSSEATALAALAVMTVIQVAASVHGPWPRAWAVTTLVLTLFVLATLVRRVRDRRIEERMRRLVELALSSPLPSAAETVEHLSLAEEVADLTLRARTSVGGAWAVLLLDSSGEGPTRHVSGNAPSRPRDKTSATAGSRLVTALRSEDGPIGSLEVGAPADRIFGHRDQALLHLLGARIGGQIERIRLAEAERRSRLMAEQARRQVDVLARASVPLAPALERPEEAIAEIADIVVPEFADLFALDLLRPDGRLERVLDIYGEPTLAAAFAERSSQFPNWQGSLRRVMAEGESELTFTTNDTDAARPGDVLGDLLQALGLQSWVVAPLRVRDESVGTITLAVAQGRRGYRPSDEMTINDLVARCAIAFERGLLYREAREAARAASKRANQLAQLVEATLVLTRTLMPVAVLQTLAEQAALVLVAPHARALYNPDGEEARYTEHGPRPENAVGISSPLVDRFGTTVGALTVERSANNPFDSDDESVVVLLAALASTAGQNARLYKDALDREQRLQALIEASPLAILELDQSGEIHVANPAATRLFPPSGAAPTGPVTPPAQVVDLLVRLLDGAEPGLRHETELTIADEAGERRHLRVSTAPVSEGVGAERILAVIADVTASRLLEEQLADAQRYEAIATLAGGVAHDFNNLLTVILGYSEMLLRILAETSPEREQVEAIQEAGNHAAVITNQLLTLSRQQVLQPETIEPAARCAALLPMLQRLAGDAVSVHARLEGHARIRVDPGQLEQVLFNLVLNSRDAMPHGGHIAIEAGDLMNHHGEDAVIVRVTDDGEGMDAATLARCREPFFSTKGRSRGNGLGLATVASILQRSGGTLDLASERGVGTTATVLFRSVVGEDPLVDHPQKRDSARVLLVDDDDQVRRFAARVLTDEGYSVTAVSNGESAIGEAELDDFDLVVTDAALPAMSGFDVIRTFRSRWPDTACLLITGFADTDTLNTDVGDTMLVSKPFTPEALLRSAASALPASTYGSNR